MVKIIHDGGELDLNPKDETSIATLKDLISENTPILIESQHYNSASQHIYPTIERNLFFSNGQINSELGIASRLIEGKSVIAKASQAQEETNWGMEGYTLNVYNKSNGSPRIIPPYYHTQEQYNEGTFSPAGGSSWTTFSNGGTQEILIGKAVREKYDSELRAIVFAEQGFCFDLPGFYSMPGYLITQKGKSEKEEQILENEASHLTCISASRRLISEAGERINSKNNKIENIINPDLIVNQVGWYRAGHKMFNDGGYPVNDEDYAVNELSHPSRLVGFVKVARGGLYGRTFVYPAKWARKVFELAFSDDFISEYFPAERRK